MMRPPRKGRLFGGLGGGGGGSGGRGAASSAASAAGEAPAAPPADFWVGLGAFLEKRYGAAQGKAIAAAFDSLHCAFCDARAPCPCALKAPAPDSTRRPPPPLQTPAYARSTMRMSCVPLPPSLPPSLACARTPAAPNALQKNTHRAKITNKTQHARPLPRPTGGLVCTACTGSGLRVKKKRRLQPLHLPFAGFALAAPAGGSTAQ